MEYKILVDDRTLGSAVHAMECHMVSRKRRMGGRQHAHIVAAASASEAAKFWDDHTDVIERKLPTTRVCRCIKE